MNGTDPVAGYQLGECIGRGDVGVVRLARDKRLDRKVALKILAPELAGDAAFRARFLSESRAAAALGHPHVVPVYAAGDAGGRLYVAVRYVDGGDARSLLGRLGPLPFGWAWSVIAQVASALDAAHRQGLIHRDVKPANMLLEARDGVGHVYLSDFGMGRDLSPDIIAEGRFTGTVDYLAPEQIEGLAVDGRADLYALACAGFELLCGTPPFGPSQGLTAMYEQLYVPPPPVSVRRADLPAAVDRVFAIAMAKNPADRYPTCGQFAEELRTALGLPPGRPDDPAFALAAANSGPAGPAGPGRPDVSEPPGPRPSPSRPRPRVIGLIVALAAAGIAAAVTIGVVLSSSPARGRPAVSSSAAASARPSSPSPSPSARPSPSSTAALASTQAAAVSHLLSSSAATRKALQGAVSDVRACTDLSSAVSHIQDAMNQRGVEYSQLSGLSTSALADGAIVKTDLTVALRNSLNADRDYLAWAERQLGLGCAPATQSSAYNAAENADEQANAAKEAFVQVWNPVAARYGIRPESPSSI